MKKVGLLVVGLLAVLSLSVASAAKFSDVPPGHWAEEAVYKLADEGIILGFPDGTFRGNEFLTRYQAALLIYRLLERLRAEFKAGVDQETLAALRNAVQELAAELASLGVRVSALEDNAATKGDVAKLQAAIEELKKMKPAGVDMAALKDLEAKVEAAAVAADAAAAKAEAAMAAADSAKGLAEANADSIKALNELAVMLNQDVLGLQDRVAALEKEVVALKNAKPQGFAKASDLKALTEYVQALSGDVAGLAGKVSEVEGRVSTLERNAFSISGSLSLTYKSVDAVGFADYDVDRLFWKKKNVFSTGDGNDNGEIVDEAEGLESTPGETTADLSVKFQTGKLTGTSKGDGVNTYKDLFQFSIRGSFACSVAGGCDVSGGGYAGENNADSWFRLYVDEVKTTLTVADGQTLSVVFGRSVKTKFTEYVFDNDANSYGHGLVATLKPGFLGATVTFAYGNNGALSSPVTYDYFYAGRVALAPFENFSVGGSYVKQDSLANAIWGVDAKAEFGPVCVKGEYFSDATSATSYYVIGKLGLGAITVKGSYRSIAASVTAANMASSDANFSAGSDDNAAPFAADQTGYGVSAEAGFGAFTLSGYYDAYTLTGNDYSAYGVTAKLGLGALSLEGYYKNAAQAGTAQSSIPGSEPGGSYESAYGAKLSHDGGSDKAFVKGLNFTVKYNNDYVAPQANLDVYGDFSGKLGPLDLLLLGGYFADMTAGTNTVKYGVKVETDPFALPLKPALAAGYVARTSSGGSAETKWFAGVKFKEFLFAHSEFRAGYSSYSATNVASFSVGEKDKAFVASEPYIYSTDGANSGTLTGFLLSWTYYDLTATFLSAVDNAGNYADAFQISYQVNF